MRLIYLILLLAASAGAQSITNVISPFWLPATGTYQGLAGVPGGIDQYSTNYTMFCNVKVAIPGTALVAYGDGMHDDTAALRFAVQACPNGQFVYIPAGNYLITQGLYRANSSQWDGQTHPYSIIIRGDGMGKTVLLNYSGDSAITFAFDGAWAGLPLAAAPARGSTNLTTAGTFPSVPVGTWIKVQHDYDAANVYTPTNTDPQPYYVVYRDTAAQWVRVTKIAGNTVSFWPPLNEGYASDTLTIPGQNAYRSGIENLTVVQLNEVNVANIRIRYAQESWVKNVESRQARGYHISIEMCAGTEVRGCYVHEPFPNKNGANGGGGSDYGICLGFTSSGCLVEDNIALHCRHSFIMETGCGQNNVIAYNFGKDNLHEGLFTTDWQEDTDYHGGEQRWCLWEGNVVPQITADTVEGATRYVTFFRNFVTRDGLPSVKFNMYAVNLQRGSWYDTVCANVYNSTAGLASAGTPTYLLGSWQVFCIGDADTGQIGNSQDSNYKGAFGSNLLAQYTFQTKTLNKFHGNYDMTSGNFDYSADGRLLFTKSFNLASLPPSLCYPAKPAWYGTNIWPAFGGDVPGFTNLIPAQVRAARAVEFQTVFADGYRLTTNATSGGTVTAAGNGSYFNLAWVGISATADATHTFSGWSGYPVANSNSPTTYLIMPASNITVTANFVTGPSHTLTVIGGTGTGSYAPGTAVAIAATPPAGQQFISWAMSVPAITNTSTTTITMPASDVTATAIFGAAPALVPPSHLYFK